MKASVFIGTSLDGFIARLNGEFDFLPADGGEPHGYTEFIATVEQMSGSPAEIVSKLAATGAHHLYIDGGITIQRFLRAGLIQRLIITRVPVLIGDGIPLFGTLTGDIRLRHIATKQYPSGLVSSEYHVADSE